MSWRANRHAIRSSGCNRGCTCIARRLHQGRSPEEIGALVWGPETEPWASPDRTIENAIIRAAHLCQIDGR